MKWQLFSVGKPALTYAKLGIAEYDKRLRRYASVEMKMMKTGTAEEVERLAGKRGPQLIRVVLDERGELLTTAAFAKRVETWQLEGIKQIQCFIGGASGHPPELRQSADLVLALSSLTLQHELALLVFLEQLYRVHTLLKGEPYHRA